MKLVAAVRPGSTRWLIRHEIRLAWRGAGSQRTWVLAFFIAMWLVLHVGAYVVFRQWVGTGDLPAWAALMAAAATWAILGLMLAGAISGSVQALFERGDLDLLLSSPLPTQAVFMARGLGVAADVGRTLLFLLSPVANVGVLIGHWRLLAIYLVLPAMALGIAALGMWLSLAMVRLLGARRTRSLGQVLGTLVGAASFLAIQLRAQFSADTLAAIGAVAEHLTGPYSLLWLPSRALAGEPLPLLVLFAVGAGAFWLVVRIAHHRFLAGTQESVTGSATRARVAPAASTQRFRGGLLRTVLMKEWRLILRDPKLIAQTLTQLLYVCVPVLVAAAGRNATPTALTSLIGPAVVYCAASLVSRLAGITVSGEEAPDLLQTSPVSFSRLRWLKAAAALLPVWLIAAPALAFASGTHVLGLLALLLCLVGATVTEAAGQVWYARPAKRSDLSRTSQGRGVGGVIAGITAFAWAVLAFCMVEAPSYALGALTVAMLGMAVLRLLGRKRQAEG